MNAVEQASILIVDDEEEITDLPICSAVYFISLTAKYMAGWNKSRTEIIPIQLYKEGCMQVLPRR